MYVWCRWSVSAVTFIHKTESIYCIIDTYILYTHSLLHSFRDLHSVHSEQLDYIQYAFFVTCFVWHIFLQPLLAALHTLFYVNRGLQRPKSGHHRANS